ncbi:aminodeoxychorismate lyase [Texcoconibacillus texcoconensis]|uniref:4-amino-4-deoxychorismate lyase n=1 Tax=Texcoconibacillus texcoconensis TaxID=1095777 RepID=A0A840QTN6_9BACI|nr:aminodeoxychorismate lyase [Texcoconibacillus texcoconensis]MBB5174882.1 4-amino-4-deoxychorismate lyase [Texcoconibacillus texcoconensis]
MYLYVNGLFQKETEAVISPFDHGFMYGVGLFETFRTYQGHPFLLDDHFVRLQKSCQELKIPFLYNRDEVADIISRLLELNQMDDAYFRWNVSAGEGPVGLQTEGYDQPTTIVYTKRLSVNNDYLEKRLVVLNTRRNSPEGTSRLKSHHFLNNIYGKREVGNDPNVEGLFLNDEGDVTEGVVSNVFWIKGDRLYTPHVETGALEGVTRSFLLYLARFVGLTPIEGRFPIEHMYDAEEVFITNSIQEIVAIRSLDEHLFPGKTGEKFRELLALYRSHTGSLWSKNDL